MQKHQVMTQGKRLKMFVEYAGMAMQGMIANLRYFYLPTQDIVENAIAFAHALVEKMKEERK